MKGIIPTFIISTLVFIVLHKLYFTPSPPTELIEFPTRIGTYTCHYSTLCTLLGCSEPVVRTLYNQTECNPIDKLSLIHI